MEALLSVARSATGSTLGATMYVTTEPCHNCTKHIIGAGIEKVFFMEPYPKSLGLELHSDAIIVGAETEKCSGEKVMLIHYEGISPHRFHDFFALRGDRKDKNGKFIVNSKSKQSKFPKFAINVLPRSRKTGETHVENTANLEYINIMSITGLIQKDEQTLENGD